jgi:hypothetical protein
MKEVFPYWGRGDVFPSPGLGGILKKKEIGGKNENRRYLGGKLKIRSRGYER